MDLDTLKTLARPYTPKANKTKVDDTVLEQILNNGALEIAKAGILLPKSQKFAAVADQSEYDLTSVVDNYLCPDKSGLWYKETSTDNYVRINPVTEKWLDKKKPNWRDQDSGVPQWYFIERHLLTVVPAPEDALSEAFWFYFGQKPVPMTQGTHFPWGNTFEYPHLVSAQEAILAFWVWKARLMTNDGVDNYRAGENSYTRELLKQLALISTRPDIAANDKETRLQGRKIR